MNPPDTLHTLIENLAHTATSPDAYNLYAPLSTANDIRRANLTRYLTTLYAQKPTVLMVMEAPGYRGCRITGIPVTSRKIMLEGIPALQFLGEGYQDVQEDAFMAFQSEQSATIVWQLLAELRVIPLIWNTFPFHPHEKDQPLTNRKPRAREITQSLPFLQTIVSLFQPTTVIAVGNVAHDALNTLMLPHSKVRHPAQGGKNDFVAGMKSIVGK